MPAKRKTPHRKPAGALIPEQLAPLVIRLRRENVILDSDIAKLYGVEVRSLNQAVKRNIERFPADFLFQLTEEELENLRSQSVTSSSDTNRSRSQSVILKRGKNVKYLPYAFTEQGVAMLSSVLRSPRAVEVNIVIMRTFVQLRSLLQSSEPWLGLAVPVRHGDILSPLFRRRIHPHPRNSASTPSNLHNHYSSSASLCDLCVFAVTSFHNPSLPQ